MVQAYVKIKYWRTQMGSRPPAPPPLDPHMAKMEKLHSTTSQN